MVRPLRKEGDLVCREYRIWICTLPCFHCGADPVDPHHVRRRGSGVTDDSTLIPACRRCHMRCEGQRVDGLPGIALDEQQDAIEAHLAKAMREAPPDVLRAFADARGQRIAQVVF